MQTRMTHVFVLVLAVVLAIGVWAKPYDATTRNSPKPRAEKHQMVQPAQVTLTGTDFSSPSLGVVAPKTALIEANWVADGWTGTISSQVFMLA